SGNLPVDGLISEPLLVNSNVTAGWTLSVMVNVSPLLTCAPLAGKFKSLNSSYSVNNVSRLLAPSCWALVWALSVPVVVAVNLYKSIWLLFGSLPYSRFVTSARPGNKGGGAGR